MATTRRQLVDLDLVHDGTVVRTMRVELDPLDPEQLRRVVHHMVNRAAADSSTIHHYELRAREPDTDVLITTFVDLFSDTLRSDTVVA